MSSRLTGWLGLRSSTADSYYLPILYPFRVSAGLTGALCPIPGQTPSLAADLRGINGLKIVNQACNITHTYKIKMSARAIWERRLWLPDGLVTGNYILTAPVP